MRGKLESESRDYLSHFIVNIWKWTLTSKSIHSNFQVLYVVARGKGFNHMASAGFTYYRLDRLKPTATVGPQNLGGLAPAQVYNILTLLLDFHTYSVITYWTF